MRLPFVSRLLYEEELSLRLRETARADGCAKSWSDALLDEKEAKFLALARVKTLEDRIASLEGELLAYKSQDALDGVPLDKCPSCGGEDWVRIASIVHAQHDGKCERVSLAGSRLMCLGCQSHYNLLPEGLIKPTDASPQDEKPTGTPTDRGRIPVRMPGGRTL